MSILSRTGKFPFIREFSIRGPGACPRQGFAGRRPPGACPRPTDTLLFSNLKIHPLVGRDAFIAAFTAQRTPRCRHRGPQGHPQSPCGDSSLVREGAKAVNPSFPFRSSPKRIPQLYIANCELHIPPALSGCTIRLRSRRGIPVRPWILRRGLCFRIDKPCFSLL